MEWNESETKFPSNFNCYYSGVIMGAIVSQITGAPIVYSTVCSAADKRKHQSSASLVFVRGIHRGPVNSPHKGPVMRKMFPFDDVIMDGKCAGEMGPCPASIDQAPISISDKACYWKTSQNLKATRFVFRIVRSIRQHCCRDACQISNRSDNLNYQSPASRLHEIIR